MGPLPRLHDLTCGGDGVLPVLLGTECGTGRANVLGTPMSARASETGGKLRRRGQGAAVLPLASRSEDGQ